MISSLPSTHRPRVVYVHGSANMYGASRSLLRLASHMQQSVEVTVVLTQDGPLHAAMRQRGIDVRILPWLHRCVLGRHAFHFVNLMALVVLALPIILRFSLFLRRVNADLLHSNSIVVWTPAISARLVGVRHIWHVRETLDHYSTMWSRFAETESSVFWRIITFFVLRMWAFYVRFIYFFASEVVCVSGAARSPFEKLGLTARSRVIHNGIEIETYRRNDYVPLDLSKFGLFNEDRPLLIGVVGALRRSKGQETAIEALGRYVQAHPDIDIQLLLAGDYKPENRAYVDSLHALVAKCGIQDKVVFTGYIDDPRSVFARLDISLVPSIQSEPFGTVVLESMATETPVIGTAIGGTIEQIQHEQSGLLVPPGDVAELHAALTRLIEEPDLRARLAAAGLERVCNHFAVELHIERVQQLYTEVLSRT